jgi:nickel/cobalt transporter (NicO) family protein
LIPSQTGVASAGTAIRPTTRDLSFPVWPFVASIRAVPYLDPQVLLLATTAASVGVVHTAVGLDHTLPFVVLGRARGWSLRKVLLATALCGLGHVSSSVVIAGVAMWLGHSVLQLTALDAWRGEVAAWSLIGLGLVYAAASWFRRREPHRHYHVHQDGVFHSHEHQGTEWTLIHNHSHPLGDARRVGSFDRARAQKLTGTASGLSSSRMLAALFVVFITGPCEALLPLLFAAGVQGKPISALATVMSFSLATLATMLVLVTVGFLGLQSRWLAGAERSLHVSAGFAIALSGVCVRFLGL